MVKSNNIPWTRTTLTIKIDCGNSKSHNSGEQGLLHVGVLLEGHVLDNRGQLVVITNHDPPLKTAEAVSRVLQKQRDESLDFQNLRRLFHQNVIVLES
jgi:hypothetical protein